jgi:hypothetical protein
LPVLVQTSTVDRDQFKLHAITDSELGIDDRAARERWELLAMHATRELPWVFSGRRSYHGLLMRHGSADGWDMGEPGKTFKDVLGRFWRGGPPERVLFAPPV